MGSSNSRSRSSSRQSHHSSLDFDRVTLCNLLAYLPCGGAASPPPQTTHHADGESSNVVSSCSNQSESSVNEDVLFESSDVQQPDDIPDSVSAPSFMSTAASSEDQRSGAVNANANENVENGSSRLVIPAAILTSQPLPGFMVPDWEREARGARGARVVVVDVVSISSGILSRNAADISNGEVRRNSRRMFWDDFSRSRFRRNSESPTIFITTGHADHVGSRDRWLLDFSGELHYDGVGPESMFSGASRRRSEPWLPSRDEMSERFHDVRDEQGWQTSLCSTGLHPYGTCSCESLSRTEESSTRTNISNIIMLADALFEVLGEIHHHRMSFSPSTHSLPAPEAIVNSFPLKNHTLSTATEDRVLDAQAQQCNICLVDYEEGDKIRVLPCSHEFHMLCIDKWLKEIHRVCPLCRDDVCKCGDVEGSNPEAVD